MEGVAFNVAGQRFLVEPRLAADMSRKAREFDRGLYPQDVVFLLERRGLERRWLTAARQLADWIDERLATDSVEAIVLDGAEAEACYAVLSVTTSVDYWTDHGRPDLWNALGRQIGEPLHGAGP